MCVRTLQRDQKQNGAHPQEDTKTRAAHRVTMREDVPTFRHDLGTDAADESTKVLIFLVYGNCLHCDAVSCC